ncbi:uncharacterized protein LOC100377761 [Saccoglossus kowalevskii]|uniref:Uncharacterized protein LOC100377761 n=1 Tax=Saccoglossus kowalevskii TaxID=10224 RepID=A0ABM0GK20_SACKO|nr:PREDICTED: uncharacterized protein LOC100377761 [Saccoglossus kowalevskii]
MYMSWICNIIAVAAFILESQATLENVAIGKTATQSSDWSASYPASNAVDGNSNTNWNSGSCTSTNDEQNAWWKVDLGGTYLVHEVIVTNRQDCCETRVLGAEIRIGLSDDISQNSQCGEKITSSQTSQSNIHFHCSSPIVGRYVSIQLVDRSDLLNFCEMQVMAEGNVALKGTASQINTAYDGPANYAIDGNDDSIYGDKSCSHTAKTMNSWWKVDLGATYDISKVVITNRQDCCSDRINGGVVLVGEHSDIRQNDQCGDQIDWGTNTYGEKIPFDCQLSGRYVGVQLRNHENYLHICEVEVFGGIHLENVALKGTASQSSTAYNGPANYAIDGNDDSIYGDKSCSHTAKEQDAWWKLDLGETYSISQVVITNRQDCCSERIDGAVVLIGEHSDITQNDQCGDQIYWNANTYEEKITFDCQLRGRYVAVQLKDHTNYLHMCEVEVFGEKPPLRENIALKGTASQSSTAYDGPANYAIDGNDDSIYGDKSCSHTAKEKDAWWKLDLGETFSVSHVVITNREDCCSERIDGAVVLIGDNPDISQNAQCGDQIDWNANTYEEKITFDCQLSGRYVGVQLKDHNNYLHMCEVEVYGEKQEASEGEKLENVAQKGTASQISTAYDGPANYAIDGNDDSIYGDKSCSHTGKEQDAWWKLDLGETYSISQVVITNRQDCCSERIDGAVVFIGDSSDISQNGQCGDQIDWNANTYGEKITFDCQLSGRYVAVQLKDHNNYLHMCEVEVYGMIYSESDMSEGAVDAPEIQGSGWEADLGATYDISQVVITNQQECFLDGIDGAVLTIGDNLDISQNDQCDEKLDCFSNMEGEKVTFNCKLSGRYVGIQLENVNNDLNKCDVQVCLQEETENIALKGTASQSSTAYDGPANYAIDGNDDSIYGDKSCSHTAKEQSAWWKLDLGDTYSISQVVITNRQDCCSERIDGAVVLIGDNSDISQNDQCGDQIDWNANTYGEKITFDCQLSGRYVAVQLKDHNNYLHMCEVEVYGY